MSFEKPLKFRHLLLIVITVFITTGFFCAYGEDFVIDGVYEAAIDLPRILFLLKRDANGAPLEYEGNFELNYAFLDTGASGVLLSKETADALGISLENGAQYVDAGVGGDEYFDVSEPLYIGTLDYNSPSPNDVNTYLMNDQWHLQIRQDYADPFIGAIDVLGMPSMAGKIAVLDLSKVSNFEYFTADVIEGSSSNIPPVDIKVALRYEKYIMPDNPQNIPPLPVLGYNPVIDNITVDYNGISSKGNWLFDTGGTISLMSVKQGAALGLTDDLGEPIIPVDFNAAIGGIGGSVTLPGFQINSLTVPTLNGFNMVFKNTRVCVHDIGYVDAATGETVILDGVFGSNFLCPSANISTLDIRDTPFKKIVINNIEGTLGFDVNDIYYVPVCGDANHPYPVGDLTGNCKVDFYDLEILGNNWLNTNCSLENNYCNGGDIDKKGQVDLTDYVLLANNWGKALFDNPCGTANNPRPDGDLDHNCRVDILDINILADEWLNDCNWLNYNCRGADLIPDHITNLSDFGIMANQLSK